MPVVGGGRFPPQLYLLEESSMKKEISTPRRSYLVRVTAFLLVVGCVPLLIAMAQQRERERGREEGSNRERAERAEHREGAQRERDREESERERGEARERDREREHAEGRERESDRRSDVRRRDGQDRDRPRVDLRRVLEGLEHGIEALRAIRKFEEVEHLQKIAQAVRREIGETPRAGHDNERAVAMRQLEVMKLALPALREANKGDAAELLQLAIRAREVTLEGRRDREAQTIRSRAPKPGAQAEILGLASRLWREFGNADKAEAVGTLARQMGELHRRQQDRRPDAREGREREHRDGDRERERDRDEG